MNDVVKKYRKRPLLIEAIRFTEETKNRVFDFVTCDKYAAFELDQPVLHIQTLEGLVVVHLGDWVIKGIAGEFYPCRDDIFRETYEIIEV